MGYLSTQPHLHHYHTASAQVSRQPAHAPQSFYRHQLGSPASTLVGSRSRMTRIRAIESGAHTAQLGAGIVGGRGRTIRLGGGWLVMESLSITTRQLRSSNGGWGRTHGHIVGGGRDRRELGLFGACCSLLHGLVARPVGDHHAADGEDGEDGDGEEEEPIGHGSWLAQCSTAWNRVGEGYQRRTAKAMTAFTTSKTEPPPPSSATISAKLASQKTEVTK